MIAFVWRYEGQRYIQPMIMSSLGQSGIALQLAEVAK